MSAQSLSLNPFLLPESLVAQPAETRSVRFPEGLVLESGQTLSPLTLAYRTYGRLNRRRSNAVLVIHALSGSAAVDQWWPELIGAGKALDPDEHYIICVNLLGSCYGSSGPITLNNKTGQAYQADFPKISIRDQVEAQRKLLTYLGISRLKCIIGPSLGGMIALEWPLVAPQSVASLILVATTATHSAQSIALSEIQRNAIRLDPDFCDGYYTKNKAPVRGLALARQLAHVGYRSPQSLHTRFDRQKSPTGRYGVLEYLDHQGEKFCARFDANSYIRLSECMNTHDIGRGREDVESALRRITQPTLVISISSDQLYPVAEQTRIAAHLRHARHVIVNSDHGHDGFLLEHEAVSAPIAKFLKRIVQVIK